MTMGVGDFTAKEHKCTFWNNRNFVSHYLWCGFLTAFICQCSTVLLVLHGNFAQ